jgi:hypothetical protein
VGGGERRRTCAIFSLYSLVRLLEWRGDSEMTVPSRRNPAPQMSATVYRVQFEFCTVIDYIGWHRRASVLHRRNLVSGRV